MHTTTNNATKNDKDKSECNDFFLTKTSKIIIERKRSIKNMGPL
jgi:hypothetical protein